MAFLPVTTGGPSSPAVSTTSGTPTAGTLLGAPTSTPADPLTPAGARTPAGPHGGPNERARFFANNRSVSSEDIWTLLEKSTDQAMDKNRRAALEAGAESLDRLLGEDGEAELAEYEKLSADPELLAVKLAELVMGGITIPDPESPAETPIEVNMKPALALLDLTFVRDEQERKEIREKARCHIDSMEDKGGVMGDHERVIGASQLLDKGERWRLPQASRLLLEKLEHGLPALASEN